MRSIKWAVSAIFIVILTTSTVMAENGFIQVTSLPGIKVHLDGKFVGATTEEYSGLILQNVTPGQHTLRLEQKGRAPEEVICVLGEGQVLEYVVKPQSKLDIIEESPPKITQVSVGQLLIQSVPISCRVQITLLSVDYPKTKDRMVMRNVPVGKYTVIFKGMNDKELSKDIVIYKGEQVHVMANLIGGNVRNLTEENKNRARLAQEESEWPEEKKIAKRTEFFKQFVGTWTGSADDYATSKTLKCSLSKTTGVLVVELQAILQNGEVVKAKSSYGAKAERRKPQMTVNYLAHNVEGYIFHEKYKMSFAYSMRLKDGKLIFRENVAEVAMRPVRK